MFRTPYILAACVLSLVIRYVGFQYPQLIENYYSNGFFIGVRFLLSSLFSWLPIPAVYIVLPLLLGAVGYSLHQAYTHAPSTTRLHKIKRLATRFLYIIALLLTVFLWIWGYNYQRVKIADKLALQLSTAIPLASESYNTLCLLDSLRQRLAVPDSVPISNTHIHFDKETEARQALQNTLQTLQYPSAHSYFRARKVPHGSLLRVGIAGIYFPYTGEGHYDGGLHPLSQLFTIPHELAHGYGFGDEGECNFLAYLACTQSANPYIQYAGHLYYARYLWSAYRSQAPQQYTLFAQQMPRGILNDLKDIRQYAARYPDLAPRLQDATNNAYLKTQGIRTGIKSYDEIVPLVWAWKQLPQNKQKLQ